MTVLEIGINIGNRNINVDHEGIVSLINEEQYEELVKLCQDIIISNPYCKEVKLVKKIILNLINLNESTHAIDICKTFLTFVPSHNFIRKVFDEFLRYNHNSGALDLCSSYLEVNAEDGFLFLTDVLLEILNKCRDQKKIINLLRGLLKIKPQKYEFVCELVQWAVNTRKYVIASELILLLFKISRERIDFFFRILVLFNDNGENLKALELCKEMLKLSPKSVGIRIALGYTYTRLGKYKKALKTYTYGLKLSCSTEIQQKFKIKNYIGFTYNSMGYFEKAIEMCKNSILNLSNSIDSYNQLGFAWYKKGDFRKAIKFTNNAIRLNLNNYRAWATLGQINLELNNFYDAFTACNKCLRSNNQYLEGISLYNQFINNRSLKILSIAIPKIMEYGYREDITEFDKTSFSSEFMKEQRYLSYSEIFKNFLKQLNVIQSEDIIAIYLQIPKCSTYNLLLKVKGEAIDLKKRVRKLFLKCIECGQMINYEIPLKQKEHILYLKIHVVVKSLSGERSSKLDYEKIMITYFTLKEVQKHYNVNLRLKLKHSVLIYGEDIRVKEKNIKKDLETLCLERPKLSTALKYFQENC